jgi:hypothetical protein
MDSDEDESEPWTLQFAMTTVADGLVLTQFEASWTEDNMVSGMALGETLAMFGLVMTTVPKPSHRPSWIYLP